LRDGYLLIGKILFIKILIIATISLNQRH